MTNSDIRRVIRTYGFDPSETVCGQIREYISILLRWNQRISLTTIVDPWEVLRFHFGESIFGLTSGGFLGCRLADVGSGAGFPGIPLHLARPDLKPTLIEPTLKKCVFLEEVKRDLGLEEVHVFRGRMEDFYCQDSFDLITSRALGRTEELLAFARRSLEPSGKIFLWIGEHDASSLLESTSDHWNWSNPIRIPNSERRFILTGSVR
jgi:16S rRNA (guanine527-N7)-methyltransferase